MSNYGSVNYSDIGARIDAFAVAVLLENAQPQLCLEQFAKVQDLPKNKSQTVKWKRAVPFEVSTTQLTEGVTPSPEAMEYENIQVQIKQYG